MIVKSCATPAVCVLEPVILSRVAVPGVPVAVKVTGEPDSAPEVAVSVLDPAVVPSVQAGDVAMPELSVVTVAGDPGDAKDPPPDATANVTDSPCTGLPAESVTNTEGAVATADPAVADCPSPALTAMVAAGPGPVAVMSAVADVSTPDAKVNVVATESDPVKDRPVKVATPLIADMVVVPVSVPLAAVSVTLAVEVVTLLS